MFLTAENALKLVEGKLTPEDEETHRIGVKFAFWFVVHIERLITSAVKRKQYQVNLRFRDILDAEERMPSSQVRGKSRCIAEHEVKKLLTENGYNIILDKNGWLCIKWRQ